MLFHVFVMEKQEVNFALLFYFPRLVFNLLQTNGEYMLINSAKLCWQIKKIAKLASFLQIPIHEKIYLFVF